MYKLTILLFVIFSLPAFAASKCQTEWDAYKAVQKQLRQQSYEWLRDKERRKHKEYQDCRKSKNNKSSSTIKPSSNNQKTYAKYKPLPKYGAYPCIPSKVNVAGRYSGEKQQAWLDYYHSPKGCKNPKSTSQFSKCLQHRDDEANKFEKVWDEQNAPPSITLDSN